MPEKEGFIRSKDICNQAVVERILADSSVSSIKIAASLQSDNYVAGQSGWLINRDTGDVEFNDLLLRGDLISTNWDGSDPLDLSAFNGTATAGFAFDSSVGAAQLMGPVYASNFQVVETGANGLRGKLSIQAGTNKEVVLESFTTSTDTDLVLDSANDMYFRLAGSNVVDLIVGVGGYARFEDPIRADPGAVGTPGVGFDGDPDTGIYNVSADVVGITVGGGQMLRIATTDVRINTGSGSATVPNLTWTADSNTGFSVFGNSGFVTWIGNGVEGGRLYGFGSRVQNGSVTVPSMSFFNDSDVGLYLLGANQLGLTAGGAAQMGTGNSTNPGILVASGSGVTRPGIAWTSDTDTGIRLAAAGDMRFVVAGVDEMIMTAGQIDMQANTLIDVNEIVADVGAVSDPSYTFDGVTTSGMYYSSGVRIAVGGSQKLALTSTSFVAQEIYDNTTLNAANVNVDSSGVVSRDTSLEQFKDDIQPWVPDGTLYQLVPITFFGKRGNIKEPPETWVRADPSKYLGFGANFTDTINSKFVTKDKAGIQWNAIVAALVGEIQALEARVQVLEAA